MPQFNSLEDMLMNNRRWVESVKSEDPDYFDRLKEQHAPEVLWIGCSDSRVPANQLLGLSPGQVFVHRNVGNQASHSDTNAMTCLEYAVEALKVRHIIVCGHHGCGAVKGSLMLPKGHPGLVNMWISGIRDIYHKQKEALVCLGGIDAQCNRLSELNVIAQVLSVATTPIVQAAWWAGRPLSIHGLIYDLQDGLLQPLIPSINCMQDLEMVEGLGTSGVALKNVFNTLSWFCPETHAEEQAERPQACIASAC